MMKVILLTDVKNTGKKGEIVEVADGFGRNYLLARKLAVDASKTSIKVLNDQISNAQELDQKNRQDAIALAKELENIQVEFSINVGNNGKVSGSISTKQIVQLLADQYNIVIDKRKFKDSQPLTNLGLHKLQVELYKGVIGIVNVYLRER